MVLGWGLPWARAWDSRERELWPALHTRLPEPVLSPASEPAPLILEIIWSLWSKQWVKQAVFWSVFSSHGSLPQFRNTTDPSLALFLKWKYGPLYGLLHASPLAGLSGVISSLFMDEAHWKSCVSTWAAHKQDSAAGGGGWCTAQGCSGNPHQGTALWKVRPANSWFSKLWPGRVCPSSGYWKNACLASTFHKMCRKKVIFDNSFLK